MLKNLNLFGTNVIEYYEDSKFDNSVKEYRELRNNTQIDMDSYEINKTNSTIRSEEFSSAGIILRRQKKEPILKKENEKPFINTDDNYMEMKGLSQIISPISQISQTNHGIELESSGNIIHIGSIEENYDYESKNQSRESLEQYKWLGSTEKDESHHSLHSNHSSDSLHSLTDSNKDINEENIIQFDEENLTTNRSSSFPQFNQEKETEIFTHQTSEESKTEDSFEQIEKQVEEEFKTTMKTETITMRQEIEGESMEKEGRAIKEGKDMEDLGKGNLKLKKGKIEGYTGDNNIFFDSGIEIFQREVSPLRVQTIKPQNQIDTQSNDQLNNNDKTKHLEETNPNSSEIREKEEAEIERERINKSESKEDRKQSLEECKTEEKNQEIEKEDNNQIIHTSHKMLNEKKESNSEENCVENEENDMALQQNREEPSLESGIDSFPPDKITGRKKHSILNIISVNPNSHRNSNLQSSLSTFSKESDTNQLPSTEREISLAIEEINQLSNQQPPEDHQQTQSSHPFQIDFDQIKNKKMQILSPAQQLVPILNIFYIIIVLDKR